MKRIFLNMLMLSFIVGLSYCGGKKEEKATEKKEETKKEEEVKKEETKKEDAKKDMPANSALKLATDFKADAAGMKGKEVTVSGEIITSTTVKNNGIDEFQITVKDTKEDKMGAFCVIPLKDGKKPAKKVGDKVTVKGKIADKFFDDVKLTDCVIVE